MYLQKTMHNKINPVTLRAVAGGNYPKADHQHNSVSVLSGKYRTKRQDDEHYPLYKDTSLSSQGSNGARTGKMRSPLKRDFSF